MSSWINNLSGKVIHDPTRCTGRTTRIILQYLSDIVGQPGIRVPCPDDHGPDGNRHEFRQSLFFAAQEMAEKIGLKSIEWEDAYLRATFHLRG